MIRLTRLDRQEVVLNCDLIESVDSRPDTTIRLVTGHSQVVRESVEDVLTRIRDWRASVLERSGLAGLVVHPVSPVLAFPLVHALAAERDDAREDHALEIPA
jgi:flagellar protein FlbD